MYLIFLKIILLVFTIFLANAFKVKNSLASFGQHTGFGEKIGTVEVVDPFFSKDTLGIACQGSKKYYRSNYDHSFSPENSIVVYNDDYKAPEKP